MLDIKHYGKCDLHNHTFFCDGKDSPEDMVESAIEKGFDTIGLVCHSFIKGQESWCIKNADYNAFKDTVYALKIKYHNKINILCGVEKDLLSNDVPDIFDYYILSVHILEKNGIFFAIDDSAQVLVNACNTLFNGNWSELYALYYNTLYKVSLMKNVDIIAHFDLITKFNEGDILFSTSKQSYKDAWKACVDALLKTNAAFEINTGAISRGYKSTPYPSIEIIEYIKTRQARFVLASDSHKKEDIGFKFDKYELLV